jgi:hypothetical protein
MTASFLIVVRTPGFSIGVIRRMTAQAICADNRLATLYLKFNSLQKQMAELRALRRAVNLADAARMQREGSKHRRSELRYRRR